MDWPDPADDDPVPDIPIPHERRRGPWRWKPAPVVQLPGPDGPVLPLH